MIVKRIRYRACGRQPISITMHRAFDFAGDNAAAFASGGGKHSAMPPSCTGVKLHTSDRRRRSERRLHISDNHFCVSVADQMQIFADAPLLPNMWTQMYKRFSERALTEQ